MKKKTAIVLILLLTINLTGCSDQLSENINKTSQPIIEESEPQSASTTTSEETAQATTAATAETAATTTKATANETSKEENLFLVSKTNTVAPGEIVTLKIQGKPNAEYRIKVYYSSGASSAEGLEPKKSDGNGYVAWTWKVGTKTKPGDYHIEVSDGEETLKIDFTVTE